MFVLMMRIWTSMCLRQEGWTCLEGGHRCGPVCLFMYETNSVINLCIGDVLDNIHCL
jgi:hypothetical protein